MLALRHPLLLAAAASAMGLLIPGLYRDPPYWAAGARGTDLVTLALGVPTLAAALVLSVRGSLRARVVWLGVLGYFVYAYTFFAFDVAFNPLFLLYVATLSLACWSLALLLARTAPAHLRAAVLVGMPVRRIATYLLVLAGLFLLVWTREIVLAMLGNGTPPGVQEANLPTNPTHVLDLGFLLPLCAVAGVLLWRQQPWGYLLGGLLLPMTTLVGAFSAAAVGLGSLGDLRSVLVPILLFGAVTFVGLSLTVAYLGHLGTVAMSSRRP